MTINTTVEKAFSAVIGSLNLGMNVYVGISNVEKAAPAVVIFAQSATEVFPGNGIFKVQTAIDVKAIAADENADLFDDVTDQIEEACYNPDITGTLSAAVENFKVDGVLIS